MLIRKDNECISHFSHRAYRSLRRKFVSRTKHPPSKLNAKEAVPTNPAVTVITPLRSAGVAVPLWSHAALVLDVQDAVMQPCRPSWAVIVTFETLKAKPRTVTPRTSENGRLALSTSLTTGAERRSQMSSGSFQIA